MPEEPTTPKSGDDLLSIAQICDEYKITRQAVHDRRTAPDSEFPEGVGSPGSTRVKWRRRDLDTYFERHPVAPGRRTDLQRDE